MPPQKIQNLQKLLMALEGCPCITAKQLASLVGSIMSMSIALGPVARLMTRSLYTLLNNRHSWYERLQVSPEAREELQFWHKCIMDFNGQNIWRSPSAVRVIYSDAMIRALVATWWNMALRLPTASGLPGRLSKA